MGSFREDDIVWIFRPSHLHFLDRAGRLPAKMIFLNFNGLVFLGVSLLTRAVLGRTEYAVKETRQLSRQWTRVAKPDPKHIIYLQVGLKQSRFQELDKHLYEGQ
jgi:hypothetical protein